MNATQWIVLLGVTAIFWLIEWGADRRRDRALSFGAAVKISLLWIVIATLVGGGIYAALGSKAATEYAAAYLLERALSIDNLFVFMLVFKSLHITKRQQQPVLIWGLWGAMLLRFLFISVGVSLVQRFVWLDHVFGALLIISGIKLLRAESEESSAATTWISRFRRVLPLTKEVVGTRFLVKEQGQWRATPLLLPLS